jgi:hypothetical protein
LFAELKSLLQTGLKIFKGHEQHAALGGLFKSLPKRAKDKKDRPSPAPRTVN